jgi:N6-adenosine-specific RNA methylase IME4
MTYRTIVVDPPWDLGVVNAGWRGASHAALPYPTMTLDEIAHLSVASLSAPSAHVYLWTVATMLRHSFGVIEAWGFEPRQIIVWAKPGLGVGGRFRQTCEYVVFGVRGKPLPITRHDVGTWHRWPRGRHSEKPDGFYEMVEAVSPGPYLEMFARRRRMGWDVWGDEAPPESEARTQSHMGLVV